MSGQARCVAIKLDLWWPYKRHSDTFSGIQQYAKLHDWRSVIDEFPHDTLAGQRRKSVPYDGVLARANLPLVEAAARLGVPVVNVWASSPVRSLVPGVYSDATEAGRLCAEHLLARGFRSFATLTSFKNLMEEQIVAEFVRVVGLDGFRCATAKVPQSPERDLANWRRTERLIERWMDHWKLPVGVYVGKEEIGRLVVQLCHGRGWRVPEDVAIICGQNQETLCEHPRPSLTSIELGYERIGYEAAQLLDRLMAGESAPRVPLLLAPKGLVVRESTDFYSVEDELVAAALKFISANSHRQIGPDDVARGVSAETRTLQNHFQKALGRPVAAEIRRVRVERAKRELAQSKRQLSEIARDVGFGETMRMYEVFRRELGVTPSEYRRQRQLEIET